MSAKDSFITTVAVILNEPRPLPRPPKQFRNWGTSPVGQALMTFDLAAEFVLIADHAAAVADWKHRQQRLASWQETLNAEQAPMTLDELAAAIAARGDVDRDQLDRAMFGTRQGEAFLDDLTEILVSAERRHEESRHKHQVLEACSKRVATILRRCEERRAEIATATAARCEQLAAAHDTAGGEAALASGHAELMVVFATTAEHLNSQTRRLLDLDRLTAAVTVTEFWARHKALIR